LHILVGIFVIVGELSGAENSLVCVAGCVYWLAIFRVVINYDDDCSAVRDELVESEGGDVLDATDTREAVLDATGRMYQSS
jgi:hypothetical protein